MPRTLNSLLGHAVMAALALFAMPRIPTAEAAEAQLIARSDGSFDKPHDLKLSPDGKHLFVADLGKHAIKILDPSTLKTLVEIGKGELRSPHDVAFDGQGRLLVADSGNNRIAVYKVDGVKGTLLESWSGGLRSPEGVTPAPDGTVFATDTFGGGVVAFRDGKPVARVETAGGKKFDRPHDIHLLRDGNLMVVDSGNHRLVILDKSLGFVSALGGAPWNFKDPKYVTDDDAGRLYVADEYNNRVAVLAPGDQKILLVIAEFASPSGADKLKQPEGVAIRGDTLWISDTYNDRILAFRIRW